MTNTPGTPRSPLWRMLALSTALAGSMALLTGTARAQNNTPGGQAVVTPMGATAPTFNGGTGTLSGNATNLDVDLRAANTIINWNRFNIADGSAVNFRTGLTGDVAVLNRVTGPGATTISGTLTADANVGVFLVNPNGILVSRGGAISTGSFVASTLDIANSDFANGNYQFSAGFGGASGITVNGSIATRGTGIGLILLGRSVNASGTLDGGTQDVALVAASDVTLNFTPGSPLGIEIASGTNLGNAMQVVGGTIQGRNVYFGMATRFGVTNALLQVDADVRAVAGTKGIVIVAGRSNVDPDVTVRSGLFDATSGAVRIAMGGSLATTGGSIGVGGTGAVTIAGAVDSAGDYKVRGPSVTLGQSATTLLQQARGAVSVTADNGDVTGLGALTLASDTAGAGSKPLLLDADGDINFGSATALSAGGAALASAVQLFNDSRSGNVSLGSVSAQTLDGGRSGGSLDGKLSRAASLGFGGDVTLGNVTLGGAATIEASDIALGNLTAPGAVSLTAANGLRTGLVTSTGGAVALTADNAVVLGMTAVSGATLTTTRGDARIGGIGVSGGSATVTAAGNATVNGAVSVGGDYAVTGGAVTLSGNQAANGAATITARSGVIANSGTLNLTANADGTGTEALTLAGGTNLSGASTLNGGSAKQSTVVINTNANMPVRLGNVTGASLAIAGSATLNNTLILGNVDTTGDIAFTSNQSIATGTLTTAGLVRLQAPTLATGDIRAATSVALGGGGITANAITAGSGLGVTGSGGVTLGALTVTGNATVAGSGAVAVNGAVAIAGNYAVSGGGVTLGGIQGATGTVDVTATSPGAAISSLASLQLTANTDGIGAEALTLHGAANLRSDSLLRGGPARQSQVVVDSNAAGNFRLGDVDAAGLVLAGGAPLGGSLSFGNVTVNGPVTLVVDGGITGSGITSTGGAIALSGAGGAQVGTLSAATIDVAMQGDVGIGSFTAGAGAANLASSAGAVTLGSGTASGDVRVSGQGLVSIADAITAGGAYVVRGGAVALGVDDDAEVQSAGGIADITATSGAITGGTGLTLRSGTGALILDGAGGIGFGAGVLQAGTDGAGQLGLRAGSGQTIALGDSVQIGSLGSVDAAHSAIASAFSHDGAFRFGTIDAADAVNIRLAGSDLTGMALRGAGAVAIDAGSGTVALGTLSASSFTVNGGTLSGSSWTAPGAATLTGGAIMLGLFESSGAAASATSNSGNLSIDTARAATDLALTANGNNTVSAGSATATGNVSLTALGGNILTDNATAGGTLTLKTGGDIRGRSVSNPTLSGTNVALEVVGNLTIGSITSPGGLSITSGSMNIASVSAGTTLNLATSQGGMTVGTAHAGGAIGIKAAGAVDVGMLTSGAGATFDTPGALTVQQLTAPGAVAVQAGSATLGTLAAGALTLTGGSATLADGTVSGTASVDVTGAFGADRLSAATAMLLAGGTATLGNVTATSAITARAADMVLNGTLKAPTVTLGARDAAGGLRLGTGADEAGAGLALNAGEIARIDADRAVLDGGSGTVSIGTLAFAAQTGRSRIDVLTTGDMKVTGAVSGDGAGRVFRFGGAASDPTLARSIQIVATADAGGRLFFGNADLELRGSRIALGQNGLLDSLFANGGATADQAAALIGNSNSPLYSALAGGSPYVPGQETTLTAGRMTVRFENFALFQNTGTRGFNTGAVLSGGSGGGPTLNLVGPGAGRPTGFALFGSINGVSGTSTAVLGNTAISSTGIDLANARVNGCVLGTAAGCLTTTISQPSLNVFDPGRLVVFRPVVDFVLPFDPLLGSNNEALFAGVGEIAEPSATPSDDQDEELRRQPPKVQQTTPQEQK